MKTFIHHLRNWLEIYLWIPLSVVSIQLFAVLYYYITGRAVVDDPWGWLVDSGPQIFRVIVAIALTSIFVEAGTIGWLTPDQAEKNPILASVKAVCRVIALCAILLFFSH